MDQDGKLAPDVAAWLREKADRDYGGDLGRAVAAVVEGAYAREAAPGDPWAELDTQRRLSDHARRGRR